MSESATLHIYAYFMHYALFPTCNQLATNLQSYHTEQLPAVTGSYPWLLLESEHKGPYRPVKADSEPFNAVGVCVCPCPV